MNRGGKGKEKIRKTGEEKYQTNELILKNERQKENKWKEIRRHFSPVKKLKKANKKEKQK